MKVLVTGATGYVGGRLVEQLLQKDHEVTVLVRDSDRASGRSWLSAVKVIEADLLVEESLEGFLDDIDVAYYLVHSMYSDESFAAKLMEEHNPIFLSEKVYLKLLFLTYFKVPSEPTLTCIIISCFSIELFKILFKHSLR